MRPYLTPRSIEPQRPSGGGGTHWGRGLTYQKLTFRRERSRVLSKICIRGEEGYYSSAVSSEKAQEIGVRRKRYWIPPDEYQHNPQAGADRLLMDAGTVTGRRRRCCPTFFPSPWPTGSTSSTPLARRWDITRWRSGGNSPPAGPLPGCIYERNDNHDKPIGPLHREDLRLGGR